LANRDGDEIKVDAWLERFGADLARLNVLVLLTDGPAGASEVAEKFAMSSAEAGRHLEALLDAGFAKVVGEALHQGRTEPRYRAAIRVLWTDDELAKFSDAEQLRLLSWIVRMVNADLDEAMKAGTFAREDSHAIRLVLQVDEQGWRELSRIHTDAFEAVLSVQEACKERLAESGEEGVPALSAVFSAELPQRHPPAD
jgi:DNA-binding transcriptional ArsR family regulator